VVLLRSFVPCGSIRLVVTVVVTGFTLFVVVVRLVYHTFCFGFAGRGSFYCSVAFVRCVGYLPLLR